ncbi:MAG TPA: uroporphyrinogen-III C-methyltransferase [Solirubrobacteraceae bacterium]|jgi:uroporphyrinogen III methyltransferase/synthase|nr:uroporphyrinogen-III C-methyltransferase [Solirubrobacteraceae bacterium]
MSARGGYVYLVGAGPGDPGLLTARALELIESADVILYDRLIPQAALDGAREDAELLYVGKEGGGASVPQAETQALLLSRAQEGKTVVRLKGGDPFVFGRGGEEALALRDAGIAFEIVPGVTAGVAALAYAGIPVTHRGLARAVAFVAGRTGDESELDWAALAQFPGTLVFYMSVGRLAQIAASLIASGRSPGEPAAVVEAGTMPTQRTVLGTLQTIAAEVEREQVGSPSITVVGPVASLAEQLSWLGKPPLAGRTVAVTRARAQASGLARELQQLGAQVVQAPAIRVHALPGPPVQPSRYDLICVTSANAASELFERLASEGLDARALASARIASIGAGTSSGLAAHGITADVTAERSTGEGLVEALADVPVARALVARARGGRDVLPEALRRRGAEVDVLDLYETVAEPLSAETVAAVRAADYVTFTSASTVRNLLGALGQLSPSTRVVSIGPITSEALREHGLDVHVEAQQHDVDGVLAALLADARREP